MQRFEHGCDVYRHKGIRLDFSANLNPLGMPPMVRRALVEQVDSFQRYPDPHCRALRAKLAAYHGVNAEQVLCGNGAADLIFRICACLRPGLALVSAPTFSEYERAVLVHGGQVKHHWLSRTQQFDLDESVLDAITPEVNLVFLCSPNNPTGRLIATDLLARVAQRCQKTGSMLVLDECFIDFTRGESMLSQLGNYPNLLILRAFTKMYALAGLRWGYLLSGDVKLLQRIASFGASWSVSGPAQEAGLAALAEEGWIARTRAYVSSERALLSEKLESLGLRVLPGEANYLLVKARQPLYRSLLQSGILVRDCGNYSGLDSGFIRVAVRPRGESEELLRALRELLHG